MQIVWSPRAASDLTQSLDYITERNPAAADDVQERIRHLVALLEETPHIGRPGRTGGTRELVITDTPYVVAYRVTGNAVRILRVMHGARHWPASFR